MRLRITDHRERMLDALNDATDENIKSKAALRYTFAECAAICISCQLGIQYSM